jgi:hypothetical protein
MYAVYGSEDAAEPALGSDRKHRDAPRFRGKNERGEVVGKQRWPCRAAAAPGRVTVASAIVQVPG